MERLPLHPGECLYLHQAEKRRRADFGECLLLEVEPPFLSGTSPPLETLFSLFHIFF